jgi:hypothetical protein
MMHSKQMSLTKGFLGQMIVMIELAERRRRCDTPAIGRIQASSTQHRNWALTLLQRD